MDEKKYQVVVEGTIMPGFDKNSVTRELAKILRRDTETAAKLIAGKRRIIGKHLSHEKAEKYRTAIEKCGARCSVRPEGDRDEVPGPQKKKKPVPPPVKARFVGACPGCGFTPEAGVPPLKADGECPRCGIIFMKFFSGAAAHTPRPERAVASADTPEDKPVPRALASMERRALAGAYTFSVFLLVYLCFVMLVIVYHFPFRLLEQSGTRFINLALYGYSIFTSFSAALVTALLGALINNGRSPGQRETGIHLYHADVVSTGKRYIRILLRTGAVLLLSFGPGIVLIFALAWLDLVTTPTGAVHTGIVAAVLTWAAHSAYVYMSDDHRGLLDLAAGTWQYESEPLPSQPHWRAFIPTCAIVGILFIWIILMPLM